MKLYYKILNNRLLWLGFFSGLLFGCSSGGGNSTSNTPQNTGLYFTNKNIQVANGSVQTTYLTLANPSSTQSEHVLISTKDKTVATSIPSECVLSAANPQCKVVISGITNNSTSLIAASENYGIISAPVVTSSSFNYGTLAVESSIFQDESSLTSTTVANPYQPSQQIIYVPFSTYTYIPATYNSESYYSINVTGGLLNSSGITESEDALFQVNGAFSVVATGNTTCQVNSQSPLCTISFTVPVSAVESFSATNKLSWLSLQLPASIAGKITTRHNYTPITIQLLPDPRKLPGQIALGTIGNITNIPVGMNSSVLINWTNAAILGNIKINLTSSNPSAISFYHYKAGDNIHKQLTSTESCTLTYPSSMSCGFGIAGLASGSSQISAVAVSSNGESYVINNLNLSVVQQDPAIRTITFTNNSDESIAVGITGGGANAYNSPSTTIVLPGTPSASISSGGVSLCGPSNNGKSACPTGTTCIQGGTNPSSNIANSPFLCFYDQPTPVCSTTGTCLNSYQILPHGSTQLSISGSSGKGDQTNVIWSGNYYARTKCNPQTGICENATCVGAESGLKCGVGTGGSPGVHTLAEVTFQRNGSLDYYDVSIINGLNFAATFGPSSVQADPTNAYSCGIAGDTQDQNGGWSQTNQNSSGLPSAPWNITPDSQSFPVNTVSAESAKSYYRFVSYSSSETGTCSDDSSCTTSGHVCGYWVGTLYNGLSGSEVINSPSANYNKHCGKLVAWLTADEIFGFNQTGAGLSTLPFNFTQSFVSQEGTINVGNLQLCNSVTYSAYGPPADAHGVAACGGVSWQLESGGYITRTLQDVAIVGQPWITNVLPTINWLKKTCPTCYTFPFDDMSSTFTCNRAQAYNVNFANPPK